MGYYLIDFENVHDIGLNGVTNLSENDEICIFYSEKSEHMSFDTHVNIMKTKAVVKYIKLRKSARNYLDFQLVTHLGYLIGSNAPGPYYIISKDTGYDSALDYWRDHGVNVIRQPSISYNKNQGRFPGQQSGQLTPAALVTVQESHQVVSENTPATLAVIPENSAFEKTTGIPERPAITEPQEKEPDIDVIAELFGGIADDYRQQDPDEIILPFSDTDGSTEIMLQSISEADPQSAVQDAQDSDDTASHKSSRKKGNQKKQQNNNRRKKSASDRNAAGTEVQMLPAETVSAETLPEQSLSLTDTVSQAVPDNEAAAAGPAGILTEHADDLSSDNKNTKEIKNTRSSSNRKDSRDSNNRKIIKNSSDSQDNNDNKDNKDAENISDNKDIKDEHTESEYSRKADSLPETYRKKVRTALKGKEIPSAHYSSIYKAILNSYDKLALNNLMVKTFGSSKGGIVYNQIKDIFTDYHQQA